MIAVLVGSLRVLNKRIADDPRLSKAQVDAIRTAAQRDSAARLVGLDAKMRPVVEARLGGPGRARWAILRNGDPAKVLTPLTEAWR